jgi:ATP-dependent DNA ligase
MNERLVAPSVVQQLKDFDYNHATYPCYGQVKMDGIFGRWDPVTKEFYTRSNNVIKGLSVLQAELADVEFPLDGELVVPKYDFFTMNGLIRSFNETPTCKYYIFDAPSFGQVYKDRFQKYRAIDLTSKPHCILMRAHVLYDPASLEHFYESVLSAKHEGAVFKNPDARYKNGKHWTYLKRVPVITCECEILSAYEGLGKLKGKLGGFVVDFNGIKVKVGGGPGIDFSMREELWENRHLYIGKMMKCQYKKLTPKGSMRSPQMLGIRWDI